MLIDKVKKQIVEAMKAKDELRTTTLKMLASGLHNARIDKKEDLAKEEELMVVKKEAKKRKDAIEAYRKAGASDRAKAEEMELKILQEFLPAEMAENELEKLVEEAIKNAGASSMADMGKVMGIVMGKVKGQTDGNRVSSLVKKLLS